MVRDQDPMTEEEIRQAEEEVHYLFDDVRDTLANDLGGDSEDYRADRQLADDGDS